MQGRLLSWERCSNFWRACGAAERSMPIAYDIALEVAGKLAMWRDPMSGSEATSYPAPPASAVKGIFESVLFLRGAEVYPTRVHICMPLNLVDASTTYNHAALGKKGNLEGATRVARTILCDVRYQLFATVRSLGISVPGYERINHAHVYQAQFERRLKRGISYRPVCLGTSELLCDYFGPLTDARPNVGLNITIPAFLRSIFDGRGADGRGGKVAPTYYQAEIKDGVLIYA